jgi:hypothetical protein
MAHFAEIDENGVVKQVLVVPDEHEHRGHEFLSEDLQLGGTWIQTSYNHRIRKQFAGIGFKYDTRADVFIAPQPFPSWNLDKNHDWQAPIEYPKDGLIYAWNEKEKDWEPVNYE